MNEARRRLRCTSDACIQLEKNKKQEASWWEGGREGVTRWMTNYQGLRYSFTLSPFELVVSTLPREAFYPGHVAATENITERIPFRGRRCLRVAVLSAKNHGEWIFASGFWLPTFSLHNYQATENITLFRDVFFFLFFFHREKLLKEKLTP